VRHTAHHLLPMLLLANQPDPCLKLIHIPAKRPGYALDLVMDGTRATAAFLCPSLEICMALNTQDVLQRAQKALLIWNKINPDGRNS